MTKYKVDAVENHVGSGISIARALRISDYIVRVFPSSRSFLASFESDPPDLVILDLNMRDISGIDVLRTIRMSKGDKRDTRVLCVGKGVSTRQKCDV
ncbi:MAG: response regulator, partial [Candidatus Enteromonas sp.]